MQGPLRIGVFGSCVSRDMTAANEDACVVAGYVARQSFISATTPGVRVPPGVSLASPFQQRVLELDLASGGLGYIETRAENMDVLVVDLVDERLGVVPLAGGSFATYSSELKRSGLKDRMPFAGRRLELGTEEHFARWSTAAREVVARLARAGLLERTVVLSTPFASRTTDGAVLDLHQGRDAASWDARYRRYFDELRHLGATVVDLPPHLAVSDTSHRWGAAPYHYQAKAYAWLFHEVRSRA